MSKEEIFNKYLRKYPIFLKIERIYPFNFQFIDLGAAIRDSEQKSNFNIVWNPRFINQIDHKTDKT